MRLNFSHATVEEVELRVKNLNLCQGRHSMSLGGGNHNNDDDGDDGGVRNVRAVLLDTRGPEIRMGKLRDDFSGHETIRLESGETITLHTDQEWADAGSTTVSNRCSFV